MAFCIGLAGPAADRGEVVILRPVGASTRLREATARLDAELHSSGFRVRLQERAPYSKVLAYEAGAVMALEPAPLAAVSVYETGGELGATLWRIDVQTHKPQAWMVSVRDEATTRSEDTQSRTAAVLAIRAVELLHASLTGLEIDAPRLFPPPPPAPPALAPAAPPRRPPSAEVTAGTGSPVSRERMHRREGLTVGAGGSVLTSTSGFGTQLLPQLAVAYGPAASEWWLRLEASGRGTPTHVSATGGTASLRQDTAMVDGAHVFVLNGALQPHLFVGLGIHHAAMAGEAASGFQASTSSRWAVATRLGGGLSASLSRRTALALDLGLLLVNPALKIRIAGQEVGRAGRPSLVAGLTVVVAL